MSVTVTEVKWNYVELGRIVLIDNSKLATIVEIIDQKRVCTSQALKNSLSDHQNGKKQ